MYKSSLLARHRTRSRSTNARIQLIGERERDTTRTRRHDMSSQFDGVFCTEKRWKRTPENMSPLNPYWRVEGTKSHISRVLRVEGKREPVF